MPNLYVNENERSKKFGSLFERGQKKSLRAYLPRFAIGLSFERDFERYLYVQTRQVEHVSNMFLDMFFIFSFEAGGGGAQ